jgi:hypothetical protein
MDSQQVQRSIYGVLFVFMSLMKSLPKVASTEVLQRNTPGDWSVKDRTSCKENLHLGREDNIVKIMQVEGAKYINASGPTGAKGATDRAEVGPGRSAQAGRPTTPRWPVWPPLPCTRRIFNPKSPEAPPTSRGEPFAPGGHPQARERVGGSPAGDQPPRRNHPLVEKKEDTVERETMINGAMSSTLMGWSSRSSMGCNRS